MHAPRTLWVPFELGRPLGPPNYAEFQKDVLRSLLALFSRDSDPVLEDYPTNRRSPMRWTWPGAARCRCRRWKPAATPAEALTQSLLQEVGSLAPWYAESIRRRGRTTFGLSGLTANRMDEIAEFLARMATGEDLEPPEGLADPMPQAIRFMADDVKAYYMEAANEQPGAPPLRRRARGAYRANGGQPPSRPPPPSMISGRFAKRPQSLVH